ncbi:MAG: type IV pilus secretin PilQ [Rhodocyclales bacterium]|nr:type IV pilus secretin PilQ [Rhodocyclales bacterium]
MSSIFGSRAVDLSAARVVGAGRKLGLAVMMCAGMLVGIGSMAFAAENSIKQVQVRRDGDQVLLKVQLSSPLKALPGNWSVVDPPRVVIDFPETENLTGQTLQQVSEGDLKSLNLVQTDKLTRMVLNLFRPTKFSTEMVGDALFVRLQGQSPQASAREPGPSIFQPTPASAPTAGGKATGAVENAAVRDIVFRRGEDGQANIIVDLTDGSIPIDVRRTASGVSVEMRDAELPERLQNRRNVNDFATPVTSITAKGVGNVVNMDIAARGRWFHQAHLANNQLTIEVRPIPVDDANKLVQSGEQGQKISINFFEADATMVVRTLAEISGKNIMIDPSLAGRRLTISLDSVPYDQALEIVMSQINAAMRVRDNIVLFGDRAILQKRDEDIADAAARAADIAQLVTEVFNLSYLKPTDFQKLLLGASTGGTTNQASSSGSGAASGGAAGSSGGGSAAGSANVSAEGVSRTTSTAGAKGGGSVILSPRGKMFAHDDSRKLFVTDTITVLESIRKMITEMDIPTKQVLIEARIVEATTGFTNSFGMRLTVGNYQTNGGYHIPGTNTRLALSSAPLNAGNNLDLYGSAPVPSLTASTNIFRPSYALAGAANFGVMLFNAAATKLVSLELQAAETDQKSKTVSVPRVVTMDNKAATINHTDSVYIQTGVNAQTGLPTYNQVSAPLTLTVTPKINPDNRINMELNIAKGSITNATTGALSSNTVTTSVIVENGGTVVIGGLSTEAETQSQERVPFLGDLPYVGFLFKTTSKNASRAELLVFITPRIVSEALTLR